MIISVVAAQTGCLIALSYVSTCFGIPPYLSENRIIGGSETSIEEFPFQLGLEGPPSGRNHLCGGSVLTKDWALTAAHCVYNRPLRSLTFRAGSTTTSSGGSLHPVHFYLYPDGYREDTLDYDIALVKVKVPFHFGFSIQPVSLPTYPSRHREPLLVSGWGYLDKYQLRKPKELVSAKVYAISWDQCKKIYPNLTPRMMCAGAPNIDFCKGDSGGPLTRDSMEQVGIVSWLYKCGDGLPGVYTNISTMTDWIIDSLRQYGVNQYATIAPVNVLPQLPDSSEEFISFPTD